jgi:hypothetical protein
MPQSSGSNETKGTSPIQKKKKDLKSALEENPGRSELGTLLSYLSIGLCFCSS